MFDVAAKSVNSAVPAGGNVAPRLLVIDDDTVHRMIIARIGAKLGYATTEASSYDNSSEILSAGNSFDCITLDLSLGERDGVDVLKLIARLNLQTPIIIISGSEPDVCARTLDIAALLKLNVYKLQTKPVDLADLRHSLGQIKLRLEVGLPAGSHH